MDNWELGIEEKSGIWELRVETWKQGVENSESRIELGIEN